MNTKGEEQIEISETFDYWMRDMISLTPIPANYFNMASKEIWKMALETACVAAYRHLSPSIDRYPRWVKAVQRRPPPNKKIVVRLAFGNVEEKWFGPYELRKDDFTTKIIEWLEEEQPFESPAITDK